MEGRSLKSPLRAGGVHSDIDVLVKDPPRARTAKSRSRRAAPRSLLLPMLSMRMEPGPSMMSGDSSMYRHRGAGAAAAPHGSIWPGSPSSSAGSAPSHREQPVAGNRCWFCASVQDLIVAEPYYEMHNRVKRCWYCNAPQNASSGGRRNMQNFGRGLLQRCPDFSAAQVLSLLGRYSSNDLSASDIEQAMTQARQLADERRAELAAAGGGGAPRAVRGSKTANDTTWILPREHLTALVEARHKLTHKIGRARRFSQLLTAKALAHAEMPKTNEGVLSQLPSVCWTHRNRDQLATEAQLEEMNDLLHRTLATDHLDPKAERKVKTVTLNVGGRLFKVESNQLFHGGVQESKFFRENIFPAKELANVHDERSQQGAEMREQVRKADKIGRHIGSDDDGYEHYSAVAPGLDGAIFVDRIPDMFPYILEFLRTGEMMDLTALTDLNIAQLEMDADFFDCAFMIHAVKKEKSLRNVNQGSQQIKKLKEEHSAKLADMAHKTAETIRVQRELHIHDRRVLNATIDEQRDEIERLKREHAKLTSGITVSIGVNTTETGGKKDDDVDPFAALMSSVVKMKNRRKVKKKYRKPPMPIKQVPPFLHEIYMQKLTADKTDDDVNNPRESMAEFISSYFINKYGMKKLADTYTTSMQDSILKNWQESKQLEMAGIMIGLLRPECYTPMISDLLMQTIGRVFPKWEGVKMKLDKSVGISKTDAIMGITGPGPKGNANQKRENWHGFLCESVPAESVQALLDKIDHWLETHKVSSTTNSTTEAIDVTEYLWEVMKTYLDEVKFREDELVKLFKDFDADESGDMDLSEFTEMLNFCVGEGQFTDREIMHLFEDINDEEGDDDGTIDPQNFACFCHAHGIYPPALKERVSITGAAHGHGQTDPFASLHAKLALPR
jgi:hypothetical protein